MANVPAVPELGSMGWVTDPLKTIELIFMHSLVADRSQSNVYDGVVVSVPWIIARYQQTPLRLTEELTSAYKAIFGRYFSSVNPKVKYKDIENVNKYELFVSVDVVREGKTYSLARIFDLENGKLMRLLSEINE